MRQRRVVVHLRTGRTIMGTKALSWPWCVRVTAGRVGEPRMDPSKSAPADGTLCIPCSAIDFVQTV